MELQEAKIDMFIHKSQEKLQFNTMNLLLTWTILMKHVKNVSHGRYYFMH